MNKLLITLTALLFVAQPAWAADDLKIKDDNDKVNYSIGYQIGGDFVSQGIDLKPEMIVAGIRAAVEKANPLITQEEMNKTLIALKDKIIADQRKQASQAGQDFLVAYRTREGVAELPSGALYRVIKAGDGPQPTQVDSVEIQYIAQTIDGTEISNTYKDDKLKTYQIGRMMPGLRDVLLKMKEHAIWEVVVPMPVPGNGGGAVEQGLVVYKIELVSIKTPEDKAAGETPGKKE